MIDQNALTGFLQEAIRCQSLTGEEEKFIRLVCGEMTTLGYDRIWIDETGNAIGEIQGKYSGPSVLLDAHADTVGAEPSDWLYHPFEGRIVSDRLFGRGTADTKGNLAAMLHAAAAVDRNSLAGRILVCASVHEENFEGGSLRIICEQIQPDSIIIGEATNLQLNIGGRGRAEIQVETIGKSAHSSSPQVGECAVHAMMELLRFLGKREPKSDPDLGFSSLVLTDIHSNPYPGHSVIPNRCLATFDRRLLLDDSRDSVIAELESALTATHTKATLNLVEARETTWAGYQLIGQKFFPAWKMQKHHPLVEQSLKALRKIRPQVETGTFQFCTNATYSAGMAGIDTIGFGLGNETDAHTINESISLPDLYEAARCYQAIIETLLAP